MKYPDVQRMRRKGYTWSEIGYLLNLCAFAAWMTFGPLGSRARAEWLRSERPAPQPSLPRTRGRASAFAQHVHATLAEP